MDRLEREDAEMEDRNLDTSTVEHGETHATTGGAAAAGAVTGGVIGLTGGPIGAAIGAVGGAIVGAAAERMMHSDDDSEREQHTATGSVVDETAASSLDRPITTSTDTTTNTDTDTRRS